MSSFPSPAFFLIAIAAGLWNESVLVFLILHKKTTPLTFLLPLLLSRPVRVSVSPSPVAVAVLVEEAEPEQVDHQTQRPDQQDHLGVVDVLRLVEALEALHGDGEAQGDLL